MSWAATISRNARAGIQRRVLACRGELDAFGEETVPIMRQEAPWQDRPEDQRPEGLPHARELLEWVEFHPVRFWDGGLIAFVHGAAYARFLEFSHASKYAILQPTMSNRGPLILPRLKKHWR